MDLLISNEFLSERKLKESDPLRNSFSFEEDRLLLFLEALKKEEFSQEKNADSKEGAVAASTGITGMELLKAYKENQAKDDPHFPKKNVSGGLLQTRLAELKNLGLRYKLILSDIQKEIAELVFLFFFFCFFQKKCSKNSKKQQKTEEKR